MFGIFFAGLCTLALIRLWHPRRYAYAWARGCGPRAHRHGYPGEPCSDWHRGDFGPSPWRMMSDLRPSPEQQEAIRHSAEEIGEALRSSPWANPEALGDALTAETFDRDRLLQALREPGDGALANALVNAVERLRETLDREQRRKLAALLARRFGRWEF